MHIKSQQTLAAANREVILNNLHAPHCSMRFTQPLALKVTALLAAILICMLVFPGRAQATFSSQPKGCTVAGVIVADQRPVANARVILEAQGAAAPGAKLKSVESRSNSAGEFVFSRLQAGLYRVTAEKAGFRSASADVDVSPAAGPQKLHLLLEDAPAQEVAPGGKRTEILPMQFSDKPNFTVAGITDWTAVGGHGSDAILRTSEALARETRTLRGPEKPAAPASSVSEAVLRAAFAKSPDSFKANHALGEFLLNRHQNKEATPLLARAQGIRPEDTANGYDLARAYERDGKLETALHLVNRLLAHHSDARLHRLAGELEEKLGNPLAAVKEYEQAVRLDPSEENYFAWGTELLYHRAVWQSLEVFRQGVKAYPASGRMLTGLGAAQFAGARYDKAAISFCRASDLAPENPTSYSLMGKVELASPDPLPCVESRLARFVQEQPDNAVANYLYAMAILKRHQLTNDSQAMGQARALFEKATRLDPSYGEAYLQLGILAYAKHDLAKAVAYYKQAIATRPQLAEAYYRLGVAYGRQGKDAEAQREFLTHDELLKKQAAAVEAKRRSIKQFEIVQKGMPALPAKP